MVGDNNFNKRELVTVTKMQKKTNLQLLAESIKTPESNVSHFQGSSVLWKPEKILDNIYCKGCHTSLPVYLPMTYLARFKGSLLVNGCSIKAAPSSSLRYSCELLGL